MSKNLQLNSRELSVGVHTGILLVYWYIVKGINVFNMQATQKRILRRLNPYCLEERGTMKV